MSKKRRHQVGLEGPGVDGTSKASGKTTVPDQDALGNEALLSRLPEDQGESVSVEPSAVRQGAVSLVQRSLLALQVDGPTAERLARLEAIVRGSELPMERRQTALDRLDTVRVESTAVHEAVMDCRGVDSPGVRLELAAQLDGVVQDVGRSEAVAQAGESAHAAGLRVVGEVGGLAIRSMCSALYLAVNYEDEEEEEEWDIATQEVDG